MRRARRFLTIAPAVLLVEGCTPTNTPRVELAPDRVLVVDSDGTVIRRSTGDERARVKFAEPMDRVRRALVVSYADAGISLSIADSATGQYGNAGFVVPRRVMGRPIGQFFDCGSGLTGPLVEAGRVTGVVVTTLSAQPDGATASTFVAGTLRRSDGSSTDPIVCSSTGAMEEHLRIATQRRLATPP